MKQEDRISIPCTAAFKERLEKAMAMEARGACRVTNMAEKGRALFTAYCDRVLLPDTHPRNANASGEARG